jgi:hypothetical protein
MASNAYRVFKIYLHREKDLDLIKYIDDLPNCMRQKYLREAIGYYRKYLEDPGTLAPPAKIADQTPSPAGTIDVLKKVRL